MTTYDDGLLPKDPLTLTRSRFLARVAEPSAEPVTLLETKLYLRLDSTSDDALITTMIAAARQAAEQFLCRSLVTQSWKIAYDDAVDEPLALPMGPVISVSSVVVFAQDGSSQAVAATQYWLDASRRHLMFSARIYGFRVEVTYTAGYGAASAVPAPIKMGMLAHVAALYDQRGDNEAAPIPDAALRLYQPYREVRL